MNTLSAAVLKVPHAQPAAPSSYLMPAYTRQPVKFSRGAGAYLWDTEGRQYPDAIAGVVVANQVRCLE